MKKLFVYGSLLSGLHNHRLLETSTMLGAWTTEPLFELVDLGSYPAVLEDGTTAIRGEVYEVTDDVYADVERLEGYPSYYGRITLDSPYGEVEMYTLSNAGTRESVEHGDWREHYSRKSSSY